MLTNIHVYIKSNKEVLIEENTYKFKVSKKILEKVINFNKDDIILIVDDKNHIFATGKIEKNKSLNESKLCVYIKKLCNNSSEQYVEIKENYKHIFNRDVYYVESRNELEDMTSVNIFNILEEIVNDSYFINNLSYFFSKIDRLTKEVNIKDNNYLYRGQSDSIWGLSPSIYRGKYKDDKEYSIYSDIKKFNYKDFELNGAIIDELVHMQHYGIPTRLLDWTTNPLISLFFAVSNNKEKDGKVFMHLPKDKFIDFNSDKFKELSKYLEEVILKNMPYSDEFIKSNWEMFINKNNYFFIGTVLKNDRIKAQQGCFSLYIDLKEKHKSILKELIIKREIDMFIKDKNINKNDNKKDLETIEENIYKLIKDKNVISLGEILAKRKEIDVLIEKMQNIYKLEVQISYSEIEKIIKNIRANLLKIEEEKYNIELNKDFTTFIIPAKYKKNIQNQLAQVGITSITVYPDIQGYINHINDEWR